MRNRKLFTFIITAILIAVIIAGCDESGTNSGMSVVGTVPEGYFETFTSIENSCND